MIPANDKHGLLHRDGQKASYRAELFQDRMQGR